MSCVAGWYNLSKPKDHPTLPPTSTGHVHLRTTGICFKGRRQGVTYLVAETELFPFPLVPVYGADHVLHSNCEGGEGVGRRLRHLVF